MREIKFRGRSDVNNVWHYGDLATGKSPAIVEGDIYTRFFYVDPATVGQFTGLYDCTRSDIYPNGRPIYEGDIVMVDGWRKPTLVKWFDSNAQFVIDEYLNLGLRNSFIRVIGNVHDNPELLETKNARD